MVLAAQRVTCPLCVDGYQEGSVLGACDMSRTRYLDMPIRVIHSKHRDVIPARLRCPLCYGKVWVTPELAAAYTLKYGGLRVDYHEIELLRKEFKTTKTV